MRFDWFKLFIQHCPAVSGIVGDDIIDLTDNNEFVLSFSKALVQVDKTAVFTLQDEKIVKTGSSSNEFLV